MNILIISEKPSISRHIAPIARAHWPTDAITFVHANPFGNIKFSYPRGRHMQDYPVISAPVNRLVPWGDWACMPKIMNAEGDLTEVPMSLDHFTSADLIVSACDPDHTGAMAFEILMAQVFGDDRAQDCPALRLPCLDDATVRAAFKNLSPFGEALKHSLDYGRTKRYFDWNWNVNALAVLGEATRRVGVPAGAPPVSKGALQVLYALRKKGAMTEGQLHHLMSHWSGTGRYPIEGSAWHPGIGSCSSRAQIINNLLEADLLTRQAHPPAKPRLLALSDRGQALLDSLHPDCEDADLPFRLDDWCNKGLDVSKPLIDRYIRTFFGKQLRRFERQLA